MGVGVAAGDGEGHGGFGVVPRVGMTAGIPGDHPVGQLHGSDPPRGCLDLGRGELAHAAGFRTYTTTLLPSSGLSALSASRVTGGAAVMSHTNIRW